jgi:hypothetical protein
MTVPAAADRFAAILDTMPQRLAAISEEDAARRPGPGRWAPKEILGHLIDSAGNNHQRFVRAQLSSSVDSPGYDQENWVAVQNYAAEPWPDLIQLCLLFNRHLLHVMRTVREDSLDTPISIRGAAPVPLSFVMIDYVRHLEHHLSQILPESLATDGHR